MRRLRQEMLSALAILLAAGTASLLSAQYKVPGTSAPRPTTATFTSLVYGAPPSYGWIQIKWGPGKDDFVRPQILATTSILENGRPAPKSALCPTPTGPNCGNVQVQVTGYYYGSLGLATRFYATKIVILPEGAARAANPPRYGGYHPPPYNGYHPPAANNNPPAAPAGQAPPAGQTTLAGTIQAVRSGYFELTVTGRAPVWVREIGARIEQNGRAISPNFLSVGESVQVQGRMVGIQLWATEVLVGSARPSAGPTRPAGEPPASANHSQRQTPPTQITAQQEAQLAQQGPVEDKAKLDALAKHSHEQFLAYEAKFQMQQVDRHIALLNSLLKNSACVAGCRTVIQSGLADATQVRSNINRTMQPIGNLNEQLRHYIPPRELSGGPTISPRGGTAGPGGSPARGGSSGGCTAPQITSLSPSQGQPGDPIMISGSGFTNPANPQAGPSITMVLRGGSYGLGETFINDSQVIVGVPGPTGVESQTAYVYVTTCQNSNAFPFQFEPEISVEQLPVASNEASFADFSCGIDSCGSVSGVFGNSPMFPGYAGLAVDAIHAGALTGRRGDDQFFSNGYQLKNGWVLDSVNFSQEYTSNSRNGCTLAGDPIGSASPSVDVHCWVSPRSGQAGYVLGIYIHGPKGVPYQ